MISPERDESLGIAKNQQGLTCMVELSPKFFSLEALAFILSRQMTMPDRGIVAIGSERTVAMIPPVLRGIKELKSREQRITLREIASRIMPCPAIRLHEA